MKKATEREIFLAQKGLCYYCFLPMALTKNKGSITSSSKDHFLARSKGNGLNNNMVLCHPNCNVLKGSRSPTAAEKVRFKVLYQKIANRRKILKDMQKNRNWINGRG